MRQQIRAYGWILRILAFSLRCKLSWSLYRGEYTKLASDYQFSVSQCVFCDGISLRAMVPQAQFLLRGRLKIWVKLVATDIPAPSPMHVHSDKDAQTITAQLLWWSSQGMASLPRLVSSQIVMFNLCWWCWRAAITSPFGVFDGGINVGMDLNSSTRLLCISWHLPGIEPVPSFGALLGPTVMRAPLRWIQPLPPLVFIPYRGCLL